ncbi:glycosyltransferase [Polaromonas sp. C04]|uniref:glycosyltransferase family 2 protein n=1 Tax=Polaromonas sp. C04 TaxID=1945857 RepID=UPI000984C1CB|nr:glycosyltransferase [Polaromonas sp. C04]OOG51168.1 hypothetical protein B0E49_16215 [Polaromonas sp. C04]
MLAAEKISVVIPCFNADKYIEAAIRSVLAQEWPQLEIVVVDDGSSDNSSKLVRDKFPEVVLLRQANQGVAVARNNGISHAKGDWIAFLDADDIWLPGKLHAQWATLKATPAARMTYTAWQVWSGLEPTPSPECLAALLNDADETDRWSGATGWVYSQLLLDCVVWTSTVLAHRTVFKEVGQFDPTLRIGEDYDLWLRASRVTQILRVPRPYALYRMHSASITKSVPEKNYRNLVVDRALARWGYVAPDGSYARKADVASAMAKSWSDFAGAHLDAGNLALAQQAGLQALRADWRHVNGWKVLLKTAVRLSQKQKK